MKTNLAELYKTEPNEACRLALKATVKYPRHKRMKAINELLGLYGTEGIRGEWKNGIWRDVVGAYCKTGDRNKPTVLEIRDDYGGSRFFVGTLGDWIECNWEGMV